MKNTVELKCCLVINQQKQNSIYYLYLQSAFAISLSLHGTSSLKVVLLGFPLVVTFGKIPLRLYSPPDIPRGRGGTTGLLPLILWVFVWASSELESSWPPLETLTVQKQINQSIYIEIKILLWAYFSSLKLYTDYSQKYHRFKSSDDVMKVIKSEIK